jgi:hypothetical protein
MHGKTTIKIVCRYICLFRVTPLRRLVTSKRMNKVNLALSEKIKRKRKFWNVTLTSVCVLPCDGISNALSLDVTLEALSMQFQSITQNRCKGELPSRLSHSACLFIFCKVLKLGVADKRGIARVVSRKTKHPKLVTHWGIKGSLQAANVNTALAHFREQFQFWKSQIKNARELFLMYIHLYLMFFSPFLIFFLKNC